MVKYYIVSQKHSDNHSGFSALGHEIHLSRWILMDMLKKNFIDPSVDVIVTNHVDRRFLYTKVFHHVITHHELDTRNTRNDTTIAIWPFMVSIPDQLDEYNIKEFESKCSYPIRQLLYGRFIRDFDHLLKRIDFPDIQPPNKKFFVVHFRMLNKSSNLKLDKNKSEFHQIVTFLSTKYPQHDIIVFTIYTGFDQELRNKIKIIDKLGIYASYMNHSNCQGVISPISGGGELSQYCHHKAIHLYPSDYPSWNDITANLSNERFHKSWNLHKTTDAVLYQHSSLNECLETL